MQGSGLPIHRAHRPTEFTEVIGNPDIVRSMESYLNRDDRPTTYLLQGPRGCGKTTIARIYGKALGARGRYLAEHNISDMRGIDMARKIIADIRIRPLSGSAKVLILNECHKATNEFQNAMLEVLEEPPADTYFILCTTQPEKLLTPVKSRCTIYTVKSLTSKNTVALLKRVCKKERVDPPGVPILKKVWKATAGVPRESLTLLGQILTLDDEDAIEEAIESFASTEAKFIDLVKTLVAGGQWKNIQPIIKSLDQDPEQIRYSLLSVITNMMMRQPTQRLSELGTLFEESFIYSGKFGLVNACYLATKIIPEIDE